MCGIVGKMLGINCFEWLYVCTGIRELMRGMATLPPKMDPGASSGQRQRLKTPRGPSGSALLLCV